MPGFTPRNNLPYPTGDDPITNGDDSLRYLAVDLDDKIDSKRWSSGLKHIKNIATYEEGGANLSGYVVLQTNMTALNTMFRFDFSGYTYWPHSNIIDLTITGYAFQADNTFYSVDVNNKGTMQFSDIKLMVRTSDQKIAVALLPSNTSMVWQYPKIKVDVWVGHTEGTAAQLTGWSLGRYTNITSFTVKHTADQSAWRGLPLYNGWANYGDDWQTARYRKIGQTVYLQGLVRSGPGNSQISAVPDGYKPNTLLLFPTQTDLSTIGRCDVDSAGNISHRAGGTGYFSLSGIQWTADR